MKIIFATKNKGKLIEMKKILKGFDIVSMEEAGVKDEIREDKKTFRENALKKAKFVARRTKSWTIADDSGLCIKALNGAPGVKSARWAGKNASGDDLIKKTLQKMEGISGLKRQAYFESAAALVSPNGKSWVFSGRTYGQITIIPKGKALPELPYDVIFIPQGKNKTFAQMSQKEKNTLSHRGLAFKKLKEFLNKLIDDKNYEKFI
jgi:XTP/dITP diphosphohydrolase